MGADYTAIGHRIKAKRRSMRRTQEWLAEQIGVSVGYVSQIERGATKTSLDKLSELAVVLNCELGELVTGVAKGQGEYLGVELSATLSRMNAMQRNMLLEMAEIILNF